MDKLRKVFHIALHNFKKWITNPRIYIVFLLVLGYLTMMLNCVNDFCHNSGYRITPWVFPFLMAQPYSLLMLLLGMILLFCDAPFIDSEQPYILLRSGRNVWTAGQMLYIAVTSALYFLFAMLLSVIILLDNLSFESGWGRVINTLSQNGASRYGVVFPFDYSITSALSPLQAMALEFLLCWLTGVLLGVIMFVFNLAISRSAGVIAAAVISVFPLFVRKSDYGLYYFSPASWTSLSVINLSGNTSFPSLQYAIVGYVVLISIFVVLSFILMRHKNIDVLKSV